MGKTIFVGREEQLEKLKRLYRKKTASLVVIRGRRWIGKSRLSDNYLRFYLKYIEPNFNKIKKGNFFKFLFDLPVWKTITGHQFENLVLHNRKLIQKKLKINQADIEYDNPFFQRKTKKQIRLSNRLFDTNTL